MSRVASSTAPTAASGWSTNLWRRCTRDEGFLVPFGAAATADRLDHGWRDRALHWRSLVAHRHQSGARGFSGVGRWQPSVLRSGQPGLYSRGGGEIAGDHDARDRRPAGAWAADARDAGPATRVRQADRAAGFVD